MIDDLNLLHPYSIFGKSQYAGLLEILYTAEKVNKEFTSKEITRYIKNIKRIYKKEKLRSKLNISNGIGTTSLRFL